MEGESYCVANRCQRAPGTASPTPVWAPRVPTTKPTKSPTGPPSEAPTPHAGPITNCGDSNITDMVCNALGKAKAAPSTSCKDCNEKECCVQMTCAVGLSAWCESQDSGVTIDCKTEDPCQVLKEPVGSHFPVNGDVKCVACDLEECCTNRTCVSDFKGTCPAGQIPRKSEDEGCKSCDVSECCQPEPKSCLKVNFPGPCAKGFRLVETNKCPSGTCTASDCCTEMNKCAVSFPAATMKCPDGMRHKNASMEDAWCTSCNEKECCAKISTPEQVTADDSSGNGGTIAAVIIVVLVLVGAGVGFFLWKRSQAVGKQQYVGLNDDVSAYQPPAAA